MTSMVASHIGAVADAAAGAVVRGAVVADE